MSSSVYASTVSVGVSWNKIFAKFGSDFRKPDAITFITPQNYRCRVWEAPVSELLYVGAATRAKLHSSGIDRIGELEGIERTTSSILLATKVLR